MTERLLHESVSQKKSILSDELGSKVSTEHRTSSRNSSEDPSISSTHSTRHVSSNSRVHPRASNHVHGSSHDPKSRSHDKHNRSHDSRSRSHDHHYKTPNRKRSHESEEDGSVWTEHVSSSGRVYYYNKREDKSQWEKPKGYIKKPREDLVSPGSKPARQTSSTPSGKPTQSRSHQDHNNKELHRKGRHEQQSSRRVKEHSRQALPVPCMPPPRHTSSYRSSHSRSASRSSSPPKSILDKTPSRHKQSIAVTSPITPKSTPAGQSQTTPQPQDQQRNGDTPVTTVIDGASQRTPARYTGRHLLEFTPQAANGPSTPDMTNLLCSPQPGHMDTSGLHPLQKALLLQQQQQQGYNVNVCVTPQSALPPHFSQQGSHPSSPIVQSPLTRTPPVITPPAGQPMTPLQGTGTVFTMPATVVYNTPMTGRGVLQSASLQSAMSRLGYASMDGYSFPDVSLLKSAPKGFNVDAQVPDKTLADNWIRHNESLQSQIDGCVQESLQVALSDSLQVSGREAASRLKLEAVQLSSATTDVRISALNSLMDEINSR